jgi:chaperonin GroES
MNPDYPTQDEMQPPATDQEQPDNTEAAFLDRILESTNIAKELDEERLTKLGSDVYDGYMIDKASRRKWEESYDEWLKLAIQTKEPKTYPWPNASNVKFPLVSTAAMQFAARAYPTLIPSDGRIVKALVIGSDPQNQKQARADRVSKFMSYQVLNEMADWEEDMDRLLFQLPIVGTAFKKTYHDLSTDENVSCLVNPKNLVVNYWTKDLDKSERITEVIWRNKRQIEENIRLGIYSDVDLPEPKIYDDFKDDTEMMIRQGKVDDTVPYMLLEQHRFDDLDDDGYAEPYVVLIEEQSKKVLRITARFAKDSVVTKDKKIAQITPLNFYTKYEFIPNPDGGFYGIGFGYLLGPLNDATNTLINELIDSGALNNLQSGFIDKGLRLKMGDQPFKPGEWRPVNATGRDIKQSLFPLPTKEPSAVLMKLLELLVQSTKELASVAEIFTGKMPGQNTPATTTMATVEQGMKVFTAIYKRIYRSLTKEFKKLYRLNELYIDPETETNVLDEPIGPGDFDKSKHDICPAADPNAASQQEKLMKAQGLLELLPLGTLDPMQVTIRMLQAQEQPLYESLIRQGPPPPDPKVQEMQMKMQAEQQKVALKAQEGQQKMELESRNHEQQMAMKSQEHAMKMNQQMHKAQVDAATAEHNQKIYMADAMAKSQANQVATQQKLQQNDAMHQQKLQQTKENAKLQKSNMKTGGATPARKSSSTK